MITLDKLLTPEQVAERLQISIVTVKKWLTDGKLPGYKVGRQWRISEAELEKFVEGGKR